MSAVSALARPMVDSHFGECPIGGPGICMNRCSLRHNRALNEESQYGSRRARNHGQANATGGASAALDRDGNPDLARSTPVPSFAIAADVGLIRLDVALQEWRGKGRKT